MVAQNAQPIEHQSPSHPREESKHVENEFESEAQISAEGNRNREQNAILANLRETDKSLRNRQTEGALVEAEVEEDNTIELSTTERARALNELLSKDGFKMSIVADKEKERIETALMIDEQAQPPETPLQERENRELGDAGMHEAGTPPMH